MKSKTTFSLLTFFIVGAIVLLFVIVFVLPNKNMSSSTMDNQTNPVQTQAGALQMNSLYMSQNAVFQGKVTSVNGQTLFVTNTKGQGGQIPIAKNFVIYTQKKTANGIISSASANVNSITLGVPVTIIASLINNQYQATSVSYPTAAKPVNK